MQLRTVFLIVGVAACILLAGCTSPSPYGTPTPTATPMPTTPAPAAPEITIASPQQGATITGSSVTIMVQVQNVNVVDKQGQASVPGEGHVHFYMDVSPIPSDPTKPAIPANPNAAWAHVSGTTYTFTNVSPGTHTITVQLVNNDHTPVQPSAVASVTIMVMGAPPSSTPSPTPSVTATTTPSGGGQTVQVSLTAKNVAFDKSTITVPAGSTVKITFDNQDAGIPHNFALYASSSSSTAIFRGDIVNGPMTTTYTFTAPSTPGTYFFRCDVHPTIMTGSFVVT